MLQRIAASKTTEQDKLAAIELLSGIQWTHPAVLNSMCDMLGADDVLGAARLLAEEFEDYVWERRHLDRKSEGRIRTNTICRTLSRALRTLGYRRAAPMSYALASSVELRDVA